MARGAQKRGSRREKDRLSARRAYLKNLASERLQDGVGPASKVPNTLAPQIPFKRPCRDEQKAQVQARYQLSKRKALDVAMSSAVAVTSAGRRTASRGGTTHTQRTTPSSVHGGGSR